jgi:hypothetical protein
MSEPQVNLPISQFAYDVLADVAQTRSMTPIALIEEIAEKLHNVASQRLTETEFYHALGFTDEEIAASRERVQHLFPHP